VTPLEKARDAAVGGRDYYEFDVALISIALRHIDKPAVAISRLVERLKSGGVLVVVDWTLGDAVTHQDTFGNCVMLPTWTSWSPAHQHGSLVHGAHPAAHTVVFKGFNREQITRTFREAGCSEWDYVKMEHPTKLPEEIGGEKQLFFARGRKNMDQGSGQPGTKTV